MRIRETSPCVVHVPFIQVPSRFIRYIRYIRYLRYQVAQLCQSPLVPSAARLYKGFVRFSLEKVPVVFSLL